MADLTGLPDTEEEEYTAIPETEMTLDDIQEIADDEDKLAALKLKIERGYAALCALCEHPMEDDDEAEDDDEDEDVETSDSKELISLDKALKCVHTGLDLSMPKKKKKKRSLSVDGTGRASTKDDLEDEDPAEMSCRLLYKKIKQASHPDKIMRFSADIKKQILECFFNAKKYYAEEDVSALILCYIRVYLLRSEAFKITPKMYQLAKERHNAILHHMNYLAARPYIKAIEALYRGEKELAKRLFNAFLKKQKQEKVDDWDAAIDEDGEVYFEYDDEPDEDEKDE
jgi:hypothetical protein